MLAPSSRSRSHPNRELRTHTHTGLGISSHTETIKSTQKDARGLRPVDAGQSVTLLRAQPRRVLLGFARFSRRHFLLLISSSAEAASGGDGERHSARFHGIAPRNRGKASSVRPKATITANFSPVNRASAPEAPSEVSWPSSGASSHIVFAGIHCDATLGVDARRAARAHLKTLNVFKQSQSCVLQQIKVVVIVSHGRTHAVAFATPSRARQPITAQNASASLASSQIVVLRSFR